MACEPLPTFLIPNVLECMDTYYLAICVCTSIHIECVYGHNINVCI